MGSSCARCAPARRLGFLWSLAVFGVAIAGSAALADPPVVRIEEDWELVIATPDPNSDGPQLNCVLSPVAGDDTIYSVFEINHRSLPEFVKGGVQLQVWGGDFNLAAEEGPQGAPLAQAGETVRWTQSMEVTGNHLKFEIVDGHSETWGTFGGQGFLRSLQATDLADLNSYTPADSVANSGISYAANRVQSFTLKQVRYYTASGLASVDDEPKVVHQKDE